MHQAATWWLRARQGTQARRAAEEQGLREEEVAAALLPAARLPPVRADGDELEDARWFPAAWLHAALSGAPVLLDRYTLDALYLVTAHAVAESERCACQCSGVSLSGAACRIGQRECGRLHHSGGAFAGKQGDNGLAGRL